MKLAEEWFVRTVAAHGNQNGQFLLDLTRVREKQGDFKGALDALEQFIALVKKDGQDVGWRKSGLRRCDRKRLVQGRWLKSEDLILDLKFEI